MISTMKRIIYERFDGARTVEDRAVKAAGRVVLAVLVTLEISFRAKPIAIDTSDNYTLERSIVSIQVVPV
jgi:hypothetical protein